MRSEYRLLESRIYDMGTKPSPAREQRLLHSLVRSAHRHGRSRQSTPHLLTTAKRLRCAPTTTSKSERTLACLIDGATPSCAATEAGELSLVKELHFILRAHTIVTLYVIINIIVIIIVKRENHLVQTHSRIDRIFIVYLVSAIIQTRLKKIENSMLHELTYYPIYLFFHSC